MAEGSRRRCSHLGWIRAAPQLLPTRADWFVKCTRTTAEQKTVQIASFEEGLGRVMHIAGALEHERPFLAPLYKYITIHPRRSVQVVPSYVSFFLRFQASQVEEAPLLRSADLPRFRSTPGRCTGVGGQDGCWWLAPGGQTGWLSRAHARKLAVGVREVRHTVAADVHAGGPRSLVQFNVLL